MYEMGVLSSDVLLSETFPLDDNYKEIPERTEDMMNFLCFMKNTYKDSSQCQGATWLGDGIIAVCDIDSYQTKPEQGVIRIFRINPDDPYERKPGSRCRGRPGDRPHGGIRSGTPRPSAPPPA